VTLRRGAVIEVLAALKAERVLASGGLPLLSRAALLREGVHGSELSAAVRSGVVQRVHRGLYAGAELDAAGRVAAAVLATRGVASHRSAALLLGLPVFGAERSVHVTVPRGRAPRRLDGVVLHQANLAAWERDRCCGIAVTSPVRTLADLGRVLPLGEAVAVADAALRLPLVHEADLRAVVSHARGPGAGKLQRAITLADARAESPPESLLRVALVRAGLPPTDLQLPIRDPGGQWAYRADLAYRPARLLVEVDGYAYHVGQEQFRADRRRDRRLLKLGWRTLRVCPEDIREEHEEISECIRQLLRSAK
jgi:hypothetical protein